MKHAQRDTKKETEKLKSNGKFKHMHMFDCLIII